MALKIKDRSEDGLLSSQENELLERVCKQQMQFTESGSTCGPDLSLIKDLELYKDVSLAPSLVEEVMSRSCIQSMNHAVRRLISATCSLRTVTKKRG